MRLMPMSMTLQVKNFKKNLASLLTKFRWSQVAGADSPDSAARSLGGA